ncbi:MAG: penicillin-binding transpeptidase domain-containing protein [Anaerovoracaceae bacterium]
MNGFFYSRYVKILSLIVVLMGILVIRLFILTVIENDKWTSAATSLTTKTIYQAPPRGDILDRNGKIIAGNTYSYSLRMNTTKMTQREITDSLKNLDNLLAGQGDHLEKEISQSKYRKYLPITVAKNISNETVVIIEENRDKYPEIEVFTEYARIYPEGSLASHMIGYLGKISDADKEKYVEKLGYQTTDFIGKDGIEAKYEAILRGTPGEKRVQVDSSGNQVRVIDETKAKKGKDVQLTIDSKLQKTAEDSLNQGLKAMRSGGTFTSKYGNRVMKTANKAEVGAVVALDVKTGEILAMTSAPDYDPNLFVGGISQEDWKSLQSKNTRDPLAPTPLYNVATKSSVQPGSTFKMVTATAALECGLDSERRLYDDGFISMGNKSFGCVAWNLSHKKHGYLNLREALEVSCNYYFFDIATGKDFSTGGHLGYNKEISIDQIMNFAEEYGLGRPTGIQIPETVIPTPSAKSKTIQLQGSLKNYLLANGETYFEENILKDREKFRNQIDEITSWINQKLTQEEIADKLKNGFGVKPEKLSSLAQICRDNYFGQAEWTLADALNLSIGQGANGYTPLQMARYTATLGNKGLCSPVSLVKMAGGRKEESQGTLSKVTVSNSDSFQEIMSGMKAVANGPMGSLTSVFSNFPVTVAAKTGTAERSGKINESDEVKYIKSHLWSIDSRLNWSEVEQEMNRLMKTYPDVYETTQTAVRRAVINLGQGRVTADTMDRFKESYDNFAWVVTLAPAEDPKVAVVVMIPQGRAAANAAPIAREVLGSYGEETKWEK